MPGRVWRKCNTVMLPREQTTGRTHVLNAKYPYARGDDAYIAVPFDFLENVMGTLPRFLAIGGWIVESMRLIQG
jgi:hypothetical protein